MAEQTSRQSRGWIVGIAALVVLILLFFILRNLFRGTVEVNVAQVQYQDIRSTVSTNGKVVPVDDYQAHSPAPGVVSKLFVSVGQKVSKGQELVQMDDSEARNRLASAQALLTTNETALKNMQSGGTQDELLGQKSDLAAAQTQTTQASAALASLQALQAKGAASSNEVAAAAQRLQADQARLAALKTRTTGRYGSNDLAAQQAQVANAREGVQAAESALGGVDIHSPLNGTVYYVPVAQYDFVQAGEALLNVTSMNPISASSRWGSP